MKNFAIIENDIITNILVVEDDFVIKNAVEYSEDNPAYIGGDYVDGYFYPPQPFLSWTRDKGSWLPPVDKPVGDYSWSEELGNWIES